MQGLKTGRVDVEGNRDASRGRRRPLDERKREAGLGKKNRAVQARTYTPSALRRRNPASTSASNMP